MTLTLKKIQKIFDFHLNGLADDIIAIALKIDKKTVKKYLRKYGLLGYSYQPYETPPNSYYQQAGVPKIYTSAENPRGSQQPPPQRYESPTANDQDEQVKRELENINSKLEQQNKEQKEIKETLKKLARAQENANILSLKLSDQVTKTDQEQKAKINTLEWTTQEQQRTINDQQFHTKILEIKHQYELEKSQDKLKQKEQENIQKQKEYHDTLQHLEDGVDELVNTNASLKKENTELTDERNKNKKEVTELNAKLSDAPLLYGGIGFAVGVGAIVGGYFIYKNLTAPAPVPPGNDPGQNTRYPAMSISGIMVTNISGTRCSGLIKPKYGEIILSGNNTINQPESNILEIQPLDISAIPEIITSGIPCSGAVFHISGYTDTGYTVQPTPQDTNAVIIEPPPSVPCSGPYFSSHFDTGGFTSQQASMVQIPSSFQIPPNYIPYMPFPTFYNDISEIYPMKQLRLIKWRQFEVYLGRFFRNRIHQVELTPLTHDKGADLIGIRGLEKIVVSAKHWKENIGIKGIQEIYAAMAYYKANHALIISIGKFSEPALKYAEEIGVECWDGERLLREIYTDQFFELPE
jgi:hypothetical protein